MPTPVKIELLIRLQNAQVASPSSLTPKASRLITEALVRSAKSVGGEVEPGPLVLPSREGLWLVRARGTDLDRVVWQDPLERELRGSGVTVEFLNVSPLYAPALPDPPRGYGPHDLKQPLVLWIDPGTATAEEIASVFRAMSDLHEAQTGHPLTFTLGGEGLVITSAEHPVPS